MSELREIEVRLDPQILEETAIKLGWDVGKETFVRGYATSNIKAPLVVFPQSYIGIGLIGGSLVYDNMYEEYVKELMEAYYEHLLERRGYQFTKEKKGEVVRYVITR